MAIRKEATNIRIEVRKEHSSFSSKLVKIADQLNVEAFVDDLCLASNKKILSFGNEMYIEKPIVENEEEQEPEKELPGNGVYFDSNTGKFLYDDGGSKDFRLIDGKIYRDFLAEITREAKRLNLQRKAKDIYIKNQLSEKLLPFSRIIKISTNEVRNYYGADSVDYIYKETNDNNDELSVNILIDNKTATVEYGDAEFVGERGGTIASAPKGKVRIGNIHGHPDKRENRADGQFHTLPGESVDDRNAARVIGVVYNIEKGKVYYYTSSSTTDFPNNYTGGTDAASILKHTLEVHIPKISPYFLEE